MAAASQLITEFYERVYAYFRRLCGREEDAADLTQKTFCNVWKSLPGYRRRSSFNTWLHAVAHHVYVDWRRKHDRLEAQSDEWWESCAEDAPGPFEMAAGREAGRQVFRAVEQLGEEEREAVHLHYYQGLTLAETAETLGVATSTVKYRLRSAVDALQQRFAEPKLNV